MSTDEWEYEYSLHETESLYFTLDLSTHVPDALSDNPLLSTKTSRNYSAPRADPSNQTVSGSDSASENGEEEEEELPALQVLDLHTPNPLIKFEESVFSCYWTTDLGTQFHIAAAGQTSDPLRKGTVLDVLGISRARLLGKPVGLVDRNAPPSTTTSAPPKSTAENNQCDDELEGEDSTFSTTTGPLKIPRSILKTPTSLSQAKFLESLSKIKLAKGETDQVPILAVKHYNKPENSEAIKRKAEDDDWNSALVNTIDGKKRRRRRPMGVRSRNRGGAGRPDRGRIERGLGLDFQDGNREMEEEMEEVDRGMFGPGVRRLREFRVADDRDGRPIDDGQGEQENGAARRERLITVDSAMTTGERESSTIPNSGHLSFRSGAESVDDSRTPLRPTRPPWMGGEEEQRSWEENAPGAEDGERGDDVEKTSG